MRYFFVIFFLIIIFPSNAQRHLVGIKGGINWSNIYTNEGFVDTKYKTGGVLGLSYENQFKSNLMIGGDITYMQRGFVLKSYYYDAQGNPLGDGEVIWNFNYLALPIKGGYTFGNDISGFINIGLAPSFLNKANVKMPEFTPGADIEITDRVTKFDLAGFVECGGNISLATDLYITATISYQYSFTAFTKQEFFENENMKHYGITVMAGIKYVIKSE